jgi:hypothetical protein
MRIPNKFSGYRFDGTRNLHDPVTLAAVASQAGGIGAASAGTTLLGGAAAAAPTLAAAAPVATSAGLGILPEVTTGLAPEVLGGAQGVMQAAAPELAKVAGAEATKAAGTELAQTAGTELTKALPVDQVSAMTPVGGTPPTTPLKAASDVVTNTSPLADQAAASKAYYETAANQASNELNRGIAQKVGEQYTAGGDALTSGFDKAINYANKNPITTAGGLYSLSKFTDKKPSGDEEYEGSSFDHASFNTPMMNPLLYGANGGIMSSYADGGMTGGGPVEQMSHQNAVGANTGYPMADQQTYGYTPQRPVSQNMIDPQGEQNLDPYTGMPKFAKGGMADFQKMLAKQKAEQEAVGEAAYERSRAKVEDRGIVSRPLSESSTDPYTASINRMKKAHQVAGIKMQEMPKLNMPESFSVTEAAGGGIMRGDLGGYSDGGRLLKGPGDGVSDSIPAVIGNKQPARLADGEFVVPARIVSELGNGSTEAGARKLYAMMERIQKGRRKSVGKGKVAVNSKADKHLPA